MELTSQNYFSNEADKKYMSNSQYKGFLECEARQMAILRQDYVPETTDALLAGKYVHAWNEGVLDEFKNEHPEMFLTRGPKAGKLRAQFDRLDTVIDTIKNDKLLSLALNGEEKEKILTGELFGIDWKICIDSFFPENKRFGDLKVLKSIDDKFWNKSQNRYESVFEYRGYFTQMAIYASVVKQCYGELFEPFIAVVTKEKVPDKCIVSFVSEDETLEDFVTREMVVVEENITRIKQVKSGEVSPVHCGKCDYCKSVKQLSGTVHYSSFYLY